MDSIGSTDITTRISVKKRLYKLLDSSFLRLFESGKGRGHWDSAKHSALASIAISCREGQDSEWVERINKWLINRASTSSDYANWEGEIHDTATCLFGLLYTGTKPVTPTIEKGLKWLINSEYDDELHNWDGELWETALAQMAIIYYLMNVSTKLEFEDYYSALVKSLEWYYGSQQESGEIVNSHYTAFYAFNTMQALRLQKSFDNYAAQDLSQLKDSADKATAFLLNQLQIHGRWANTPWANGAILWRLVSIGAVKSSNADALSPMLTWLESRQVDGYWDDLPNSLDLLIALYQLAVVLEKEDAPVGTVAEAVVREKLQASYSAPEIQIKRKIVVLSDEDGYTVISIGPETKAWFTIILAVVFLGLATVLGYKVFMTQGNSGAAQIAYLALSGLAAVVTVWGAVVSIFKLLLNRTY